MSSSFKLPTPTWARDLHGETEVYTVEEVQAILAEHNKMVPTLVQALKRLADVADGVSETYNTSLMDDALTDASAVLKVFE